MRLFISISLPEPVIKQIIEIQTNIKKLNLFDGKFVEPQNLHITLLFLGKVQEDYINEIIEILNTVKSKPIILTLEKLKLNKKREPSILWLELASENLNFLAKEIKTKLEKFIEKKEEREFKAHITITRIKKVNNMALENFVNNYKIEPFTWQISQLNLVKSETKQEGPVYTEIANFKLNN